MSEIYAVMGRYDYEGAYVIKVFVKEASAEAFKKQLEEYKATEIPYTTGVVWKEWSPQHEIWLSKHPAPETEDVDSYGLEKIELCHE